MRKLMKTLPLFGLILLMLLVAGCRTCGDASPVVLTPIPEPPTLTGDVNQDLVLSWGYTIRLWMSKFDDMLIVGMITQEEHDIAIKELTALLGADTLY